MGSGVSKSSPEKSEHVFASETPVRFSQELVDSLQASSETDFSREKTLELHIQSRVAEELHRLSARESQILRDLEDTISSSPDSTTHSTNTPSTTTTTTPDQPHDAGGKDHAAKAHGDKLRDLGRESIQREIDALRKRLEGRRKVEALDEGLERAKGEVVRCLRTNDRRPLDCWREVEAFKREVGRLERRFVDRVVG